VAGPKNVDFRQGGQIGTPPEISGKNIPPKIGLKKSRGGTYQLLLIKVLLLANLNKSLKNFEKKSIFLVISS